MFVEECAELIKAIQKKKRKVNHKNFMRIIEEAVVMIVHVMMNGIIQ